MVTLLYPSALALGLTISTNASFCTKCNSIQTPFLDSKSVLPSTEASSCSSNLAKTHHLWMMSTSSTWILHSIKNVSNAADSPATLQPPSLNYSRQLPPEVTKTTQTATNFAAEMPYQALAVPQKKMIHWSPTPIKIPIGFSPTKKATPESSPVPSGRKIHHPT